MPKSDGIWALLQDAGSIPVREPILKATDNRRLLFCFSVLNFSMQKLKVLAFTASFNRWSMVENCIRGMAAQRGDFDLKHSVLFLDTPMELIEISANEHLERMHSGDLIFSRGTNAHQYINAIKCIQKGLDMHPDCDLIIKIDDDDWYSLDYVQKIVEEYRKTPFDFSGQEFANMIFTDNKTTYDPDTLFKWHYVGATFAFSPKFYRMMLKNIHNIGNDPYEDKMMIYMAGNPEIVCNQRPNEKDFFYIRHGGNTVKDLGKTVGTLNKNT